MRECPLTMTMLQFGGGRMIDNCIIRVNVNVIYLGLYNNAVPGADRRGRSKAERMCIIECFV